MVSYIFEFDVEIIRTRGNIFGVVLTNVILGTDCETVTQNDGDRLERCRSRTLLLQFVIMGLGDGDGLLLVELIILLWTLGCASRGHVDFLVND